jgi:C-terminal processing protease CtpA/Prc
MYGIGLDLVIEQTGMKVKKVVDLRDAQSQSINGLVKEGDVVLAVNGVGLRGLDGTSVIENLIWGPQNTGVVLTLRCHSTHTVRTRTFVQWPESQSHGVDTIPTQNLSQFLFHLHDEMAPLYFTAI